MYVVCTCMKGVPIFDMCVSLKCVYACKNFKLFMCIYRYEHYIYACMYVCTSIYIIYMGWGVVTYRIM